MLILDLSTQNCMHRNERVAISLRSSNVSTSIDGRGRCSAHEDRFGLTDTAITAHQNGGGAHPAVGRATTRSAGPRNGGVVGTADEHGAGTADGGAAGWSAGANVTTRGRVGTGLVGRGAEADVSASAIGRIGGQSRTLAAAVPVPQRTGQRRSLPRRSGGAAGRGHRCQRRRWRGSRCSTLRPWDALPPSDAQDLGHLGVGSGPPALLLLGTLAASTGTLRRSLRGR